MDAQSTRVMKIEKPEYGPSVAARLLRSTIRLERAAVKAQAAMREYQLQLNLLQASRLTHLALWQMRQDKENEDASPTPGEEAQSRDRID